MGVRLNKVLSELNIGLQTAVDFLRAHQELGTIRDDANPNTKIWDSQYEALVKEFGQVPKLEVGKIDLSLLNLSTRPKKKSKEERRKEREERLKQESRPIGKINLDEVGRKKEDNKSPYEIDTVTNPVGQKTNVGNDGVKLIGKIDLSTLNLDTRPKKKSKEERRKEREERLKQESKPIGKINLDEVGRKKEDSKSPYEIDTVTKPVEQNAGVGDNRCDIFVSYSRKDSNRVQTIVNELQNKGYTIWIDKEGIESGDAFKAVIVKAIKKADVFLFFSSIEANKSPWTVKEVNVAVYLKKEIIPVKLDNSEYDDSVLLDLAGLDYIDLTDEAKHIYAINKLDKALKKKIVKSVNHQTK